MNRQSGPPPLMSLPMLNYNQFFTPADTKNTDQSRRQNEGMGPRDDTFHNGSRDYSYNDRRQQGGRQAQRQNAIEMQLVKALQKPVDLGRGESMMKKMGWSGGGLGRSGEGIVEPIAPNAAYATKKQGLGQAEVTEAKVIKPIMKQKRSKFANKKLKRSAKRQAKEMFKTDVLLQILDFVENDAETELLFDKKLTNAERKVIHNLVEEIVGLDYVWDAENMEQMDIIQRILECNDYDLHTESSGAHPNRQLGLYKDAPDHMYLVIPEDLREDEDAENIEDTKVKGKHENIKHDKKVGKESRKTKEIDLIDEDDYSKYKLPSLEKQPVEENKTVKPIEGKSNEICEENNDLNKFNPENSLKQNSDEETEHMDVCDKENGAFLFNKSNIGSTFEPVNNENQNESLEINLEEKLDNTERNGDKSLNFAKDSDKIKELPVNNVNACTNLELDAKQIIGQEISNDNNCLKLVKNSDDTKISPIHNESSHNKIENLAIVNKDADISQNSKQNSDIDVEKKVECHLENKLMENSRKLRATKKVLTVAQILEKVIDYFIDFSIDDGFTEFRFLGTFNEVEYAALVEFFKLCVDNTGENSEVVNKLKKSLQSDVYNFNLQDNCNGSTVIYKVKKDI